MSRRRCSKAGCPGMAAWFAQLDVTEEQEPPDGLITLTALEGAFDAVPDALVGRTGRRRGHGCRRAVSAILAEVGPALP